MVWAQVPCFLDADPVSFEESWYVASLSNKRSIVPGREFECRWIATGVRGARNLWVSHAVEVDLDTLDGKPAFETSMFELFIRDAEKSRPGVHISVGST